MTPPIQGERRIFAILGDPVGHSLSPAMHNAAIQDADLNGVYQARRCDADQVPSLMRELASAGGGGNVTLPHKLLAAAALDVPSKAVTATGACNTFWWQDGGLHGDNTDVTGFAAARRALQGSCTEQSRVLVLGAGGAAAAVVFALLRGSATEVHVHNRTARGADALVRKLDDPRLRVVPGLESLQDQPFDLLVHTTRLGLMPTDPLPIDLATLGPVGAVLDVVYSPTGATSLVDAARARGIRATDGTEMLLQQGAEAFRRWWGTEPSMEAMRSALMDARRSST